MNDRHRKWLEKHHEDGREILAEIKRLERIEEAARIVVARFDGGRVPTVQERVGALTALKLSLAKPSYPKEYME